MDHMLEQKTSLNQLQRKRGKGGRVRVGEEEEERERKRKKTLFTKTVQLEIASLGASLVAQWLRICLPMPGTWVRALVWEDPPCRRAAGPVSHSY